MENNKWQYPKGINNSFDLLIAKEFGTGYPVECKRCGWLFIKKKKKQIFCSEECASIYCSKIKEMKTKYGKKFLNWLKDKI